MGRIKIATLVVFKNEADILPYWLKCMEKHVDYFLFRDNESTDGSAEIVKAHPKTVYCDVAKGLFKTSMKDKLFAAAQNSLSDNDWICGGAADLVPDFNVRAEIGEVDSKGYTCAKVYFPTFFFTKEMYARYQADEEYRRSIDNFDPRNYEFYYNTSNYYENIIKNTKDPLGRRVRFTRPKQEPPVIPNRNVVATRLCWAHYRFRSPRQMKERFEIRNKVYKATRHNKSFRHYSGNWDWKAYLISQSLLHKYDKGFRSVHRIKMSNLVKANGRL